MHVIKIAVEPGVHRTLIASRDIGAINLRVTCGEIFEIITFSNPSDAALERELHWYLEEYAALEPFEIGRASKAVDRIAKYGYALSTALTATGLIPFEVDLQIEIVSDASQGDADIALHRLHWELLTDRRKWPSKHRPKTIGIIRTLNALRSQAAVPERAPSLSFNILLVTCRPNGRNDVDHHLISRPLVELVSRISHNSIVKPTVKILRPPTWAAFRRELRDRNTGHFQLVHFDLHGGVVRDSKNHIRSVQMPHPDLGFLRNHRLNLCQSGTFLCTPGFFQPNQTAT